MRFDVPALRPDRERPAFHDGMGEEKARLAFRCAVCGADNDGPLFQFMDAATAWFAALDLEDRLRIARLFDCPLGEFAGKVRLRAHEEGQPYFGAVDCRACARRHLIYVGFDEVQPMRYRAFLHGVSTFDDGCATDAPGSCDSLSVAIPLQRGRVLLRFEDGAWRLTQRLLPGNVPSFAADAFGIAWGGREGMAAGALRAASMPVVPAEHAWLLGCREHATGGDVLGMHECGLVLQPFSSAPFRCDLVRDNGGQPGGETSAFTAKALCERSSWRDRLEDCGCGWAIAAFENARDDAAAMQALVLAAVQRGIPFRDPFRGGQALPSGRVEDGDACVRGSHERTRAWATGWRAAPGEPPLAFVSDATGPQALADDVARVVERMHLRRERDDARAADVLLLRSIGTAFAVNLDWYEPDDGSAAGLRRYRLMLTHMRGAMRSEEFETWCRTAFGIFVRELAPWGVEVRFRSEDSGDIDPRAPAPQRG